jgi:hypothetical protein
LRDLFDGPLRDIPGLMRPQLFLQFSNQDTTEKWVSLKNIGRHPELARDLACARYGSWTAMLSGTPEILRDLKSLCENSFGNNRVERSL